MRWVGRFFALLGFLLFAAVGLLGFEAYLSITGRDLTLLNWVLSRFGERVEGQRTERLALEVSIDADAGTLSGRAELAVKPIVEGRRRFYFLLGDSFHLTSFSALGYPEARAYKLWLVTAVDLGRAVPSGQAVNLALEYEGRPAGGLFGLGTARVTPRDIQLSVDSFWFPNDLQGQFEADVAVSLPSQLTVVHAGEEVDRSTRGSMQRVHWRYARPVPSLSLVAGPYRVTTLKTDRAQYRLYLAEDVQLDADQVLRIAGGADDFLTERYGSAGYSNLSLFVSRKLRRAYNDGAGVIGLSIRYFRRGDYGFNVIAHEIAHNWWGATVMERWLQPRTGGEWVVEGFAELSGMLAAEARYGREALTRRLAVNFFDPRRNGTVAAMSVLDNAIGSDAAREIIYNKGAYVAMMLRRVVGDDGFFRAARGFLDRYRYQSVGDKELESVLNESAGTEVSGFFSEWVRSDHGLDLALDKGEGDSTLVLRNDGNNTAVGEVAIGGGSAAPAEAKDAAAPPAAEAAPASPAVAVGAQLPVPAQGATANADPALAWADMVRENNRFPRQRFPLVFSLGGSGWVEVDSEIYPWSSASLKNVGADGAVTGAWELPSTVVSWPRWLDEHTLVLNTTDAVQDMPAVVLFDTQKGDRRTIGRGTSPATSQGVVYAARGDSLVRWRPPLWHAEVLVREKRHVFGGLAPSPDGTRLAYAVARDNDMEIRVLSLAERRERTLIHWDRDLRDLIWSSDGTHLFAAIGGNWDWQVWQITADTGAVHVLVGEAAAIGNLAVSPDGTHLAVAAAPQIDYPYNRREVIILDLEKRGARRLPLPDQDVRQIAWLDPERILAVAAPSGAAIPFTLPEERSIVRIRLDEEQD